MPPAVTVDQITKAYSLGGPQEFASLRETVARTISSPLTLFRRRRSPRVPETFRAVNDVSFEVEEGEVVGIIGRNGAGKSTLLKILSRIVYPTSGHAILRGRVGSLLEVGTGFHPELTGRENVFFNGALLGMRKREIQARYDEIVDFAGVERFLDTPIKRYSSGMTVRLAFAVAAHLEPEILIIDEVLAVGDARFQRKCLDKMQQVGKSGRTVLFVSHNMPAVTRLCPRTIAMDAGAIVNDGPTSAVVTAYLRSDLGTTAARRWDDPAVAPGDEVARLRGVSVQDSAGTTVEVVDVRQPIDVTIEYDLRAPSSVFSHLHVLNEEGVYVFVAIEGEDVGPTTRLPGRHRSIARVPGNLLTEGTVIMGVSLTNHETLTGHYFEQDAVAIQVVDREGGPSSRGSFPGSIPGVVRPKLQWTTSHTETVT